MRTKGNTNRVRLVFEDNYDKSRRVKNGSSLNLSLPGLDID